MRNLKFWQDKLKSNLVEKQKLEQNIEKLELFKSRSKDKTTLISSSFIVCGRKFNDIDNANLIKAKQKLKTINNRILYFQKMIERF